MVVGGTRSSSERSHKRRFFDDFVKVSAMTESNQKWSRVKLDSCGCGGALTSPRWGEVGEERSDEPGEGRRLH
jgi:hypothetical protein